MKIKKDNINHIFRNKYLVGSSGNVISPISSFNDSSKVNEWFYEDENGDLHSKLTLISDKDILATGGITQFIQGDRTESTIMDGVVTDNVTITKEDGILKVIGGGSDFDISKMWTALSGSTNEQINKSHLTDALSGYATNNTTFWGQSIKNNVVSGNMTNVGSITASDVIKAKCFSGTNLRFECDNDGNAGTYSSEINNFVSNVYIQHHTTGNVILVNGGGKVGIGTTSPTEKLDVIGNIKTTGTFSTGNGLILQKYGYTHTDVLRWSWDGTYGDHLKFSIPGTNDQDKNLYLSATKGLYFTGIIEATNDIRGRSFEASYDRAGSEFEVNVSSFYNNNTLLVDNEKYRYLLGWKDYGQGGWTTGYGIGSYRYGYSWGSMVLEVCNVESNVRLIQLELRGKDSTLWTSGNFLANGGITQYSDSRAKNIIEDVNIDLDKIANSPAIRFKWNGYKDKNDDGKTHVGGIAQYINEILPEVIYNSDDLLTMDYATTSYIYSVNIAKYLVAAKNEINELKEQINLLKDTINNNLNTNIK